MACISGCRGVVGFTVTTSVRPVREKVRPAWLDMCVSAKKFAHCAHNGSKLALSGVLGEVFRGNAAGGAVLGEVFRGNATGGAVLGEVFRGRAAGGAVLGEFFRGPVVVGVAAGPLLAVLTLQCAATPYGWHGGQPAQATTHRVNVRRMCSQRCGLESSQAPGALQISGGTTEAGSRRIPPLVACGGRAVNTEKSAPKSQRQKLSARASARQQWPQ